MPDCQIVEGSVVCFPHDPARKYSVGRLYEGPITGLKSAIIYWYDEELREIRSTEVLLGALKVAS